MCDNKLKKKYKKKKKDPNKQIRNKEKCKKAWLTRGKSHNLFI